MNESIRKVSTAFGSADALELLCECDRLDCVERIVVAQIVYDSVRNEPGRFVIAAGHEAADDRIVGGEHGYSVVNADEIFRRPQLRIA